MKDDLKPEEKSPLEQLHGDIHYKRKFTPTEKKSQLSSNNIELPSTWTPLAVRKPYREETFASAFFSRFLWGSFAFFLIAVAISGFILLHGSNILSSGNVDLYISGPVAISAGQQISLQIAIANKNSLPIEGVKLVMQYPDGSFAKNDPAVPLGLVEIPVGAIDPGQSVNEVGEALIFGQKGSTQTVKIGIEYSIKGSSAILKNEKVFPVTISSSPLALSVNSLTEENAGQEFTIEATVTSNADVPVKDVMLQVSYPFGYTFLSSDPAPSFAQNRWDIGALKPGEHKTVRIRGVVQGQTTEDKIFRLSVGTKAAADPGSIGAVYASTIETVAIAEPFLGVGLSFNGSGSSDFVANPDQSVNASLSWHNNLSTILTDTRIEAQLLGTSHDRYSVLAEQGFYRSSSDTILWDKTTLPMLDSLNPGESGAVSFSLKPRPLVDGAGNVIKNPVIGVAISITSRRISETGVPEDIHNTIQGKIRVNSLLTLSGNLLYYSGQFKNAGPIPPKADAETTYTVVWSIANTSNDLQNVIVSASVPTYVVWKNAIIPSGENISYDDLTGRIIWRPGAISSGTGYLGSTPRTISFQIGFTPSVAQISNRPVMLSHIVATGLDTFTGKTIQASAPDITTDLSADPATNRQQQLGNVVQ